MTPTIREHPSSRLPAASRHDFGYRPEIDGLRALAVLAVVFYHAKLGFSGGYVGVDIFFVISGYLITSLILRDLSLNRFSLSDFWERRIRRIFPALSAMVLVTFIAGFIFLLPNDFVNLGKSVVAQAIMGANIHFSRTGGNYFNGPSDHQPLLHTWSLAVEEQFYLLLPFVLLLTWRLGTRLNAPLLKTAIVIALLLSLFGCVALMTMNRGLVTLFYWLPGRAWELLCGSIVALYPGHLYLKKKAVREGLSWLGLCMMLYAIFAYSHRTFFPGLAAALPCLGASLLIWSTSTFEPAQRTSLQKILSTKILVFIGLISYSFYLWHWPVMVYFKYWTLHVFPAWELRSGWVLLSLVLGFLSWKYIETPFRKKQVASSKKSVFLFFGIGSAASIAFGYFSANKLIHNPYWKIPSIMANLSVIADGGHRVSITEKQMASNQVPSFGLTSEESSPSFLLWGDSHAMHLLKAFDLACKEYGMGGKLIAQSLTPPVLNSVFILESGEGPNREAAHYNEAVRQWIIKHKPKYVVLAACWELYHGKNAEILEKGLKETVKELNRLGCEVWIMQTIPQSKVHIPKLLIRENLFRTHRQPPTVSRAEHEKANHVMIRSAKGGINAHFLDPAHLFIDPQTGEFTHILNGVPVVRDVGHLTETASGTLYYAWLRKEFDRLLSRHSPEKSPQNDSERPAGEGVAH